MLPNTPLHLLFSTCFLAITALGQPTPILPLRPFTYANQPLPAHFSVDPPGPPLPVTAIDSTPPDNRTTDAGAKLGRILFYERSLSRNNTIACASCHTQENGFSDPRRFSPGFEAGFTARHSMGVSDSRWNSGRRAFWDERAASLEQQALQPIQDPVEMGLTLDQLLQRLRALPYYPPLFTEAFGDPAITPERVARAIAQFERSILSYRSRYDQGRALVADPLTPFPNFTTEENLGKTIFFSPPSNGPMGPGGMMAPGNGGGCATCHQGEAMTNNAGPQNNGLDAATTIDVGAFALTGQERHRGAFRAPSLRNIAARAPYMHDGRFNTLDEVVNFYNMGVQPHPQLDPALRAPSGLPRHLGLNPASRQALVRFLETLTDHELLADPRFSNPFRALLTVPSPSFTGDLAAPDSLATAFSNVLPLPEEGLQVFVRDASGVEREATVSFGSRTQVNFTIPAQSALGWANIRLQSPRIGGYRGVLEIVDTQPALFSANGDGRGAPAGFLVQRNAAGELTRTPLFATQGTTFIPALLRPDPSSDAVLELYGTGWRNTPTPLQATLNGQPAEVIYAGRQEAFMGLDQVNIKLPAAATLTGSVQIAVQASGRSSNALTIRLE